MQKYKIRLINKENSGLFLPFLVFLLTFCIRIWFEHSNYYGLKPVCHTALTS